MLYSITIIMWRIEGKHSFTNPVKEESNSGKWSWPHESWLPFRPRGNHVSSITQSKKYLSPSYRIQFYDSNHALMSNLKTMVRVRIVSSLKFHASKKVCVGNCDGGQNLRLPYMTKQQKPTKKLRRMTRESCYPKINWIWNINRNTKVTMTN